MLSRNIVLLFLYVASTDGFLLDEIGDVNRSVSQILQVVNGGQWGVWGKPQFCPLGSFAAGFGIKYESPQGSGDDTALNSIKLICHRNDDKFEKTAEITSLEGAWGFWLEQVQCTPENPHKFLSAFKLQVEPEQDSGDDTAADYITFRCRELTGGSESAISPSSQQSVFGSWGSYSDSCLPDSAICGISTRVESPTDGDDTALNDARFYCCNDDITHHS